MATIYLEDRFDVKGKGDNRFPGEEELRQFRKDLERLVSRVPVQYVVGRAFFFRHFFEVTPETLIPRPETEELVALAINRIGNKRGSNRSVKVLDIGTGTGCIAISVQKALQDIQVMALDISPDALAVARRNSRQIGAAVDFLEVDFLDESGWPSIGEFDFILSNPPYISRQEYQRLSPVVRDNEPELALVPNSHDPLTFYRKILDFAENYLRPGGEILAEISSTRHKDLEAWLKQQSLVDYDIYPDLQGVFRVLHILKHDVPPGNWTPSG
jgi:release factor glutamine methyltransferase